MGCVLLSCGTCPSESPLKPEGSCETFDNQKCWSDHKESGYCPVFSSLVIDDCA